MSVGIGAGGFVGIALETVANTYVAPTKFVEINSESLKYMQATKWRTPIRNSPSVVGAKAGNAHVEGDITCDIRDDSAVYFHRVSRATMTSDVSDPTNPKYTFTPNAKAVADKTASITVVRNGQVFGYVGCVVSQIKYAQQDGILTATYSIIGADEATQTLPADTWSAEDVFGPGEYSVEFPTGSAVTDTQSFDLTINDNAEAQFRLKSTGRGADFIKYGARTVELNTTRDFLNRTIYDAFKALTAQSVSLKVDHGANNFLHFTLPNVAQDTHEIALSGQGDIIASAIKWNGMIDGTGADYTLVIGTQEIIS